MTDRDLVGEKARAFFEALWKQGDPWELEGSACDQARYRRQLRLLAGRRYGRVLEVGCAAGSFTRHLARVADSVVALDISPTAVARARAVRVGPGAVEFRAQN